MANLSNINNKFLVTTGGNVLIGRTSATGTSKLQVTGSLLIGTDINSGIPLVVQETTADGFAIGFMRNTNSTNGNGLVIDVNSTGGAYIQDWRQAGTVKMRLLQNGNLGIGTDLPVAPLQIERASNTTLALSNSGSVTSGTRGEIAVYNSSISTVAAIKAVVDTSATADNVGTDLTFFTRAIGGSLTQKMVIKGGGNVGIGTTAPVGKLEIATTGSTAKPPSLRISNAAALTFLWDIWRDNTTGFLNIGSTVDGTDYGAHVTIKDASGFVGIGTTSPAKILDVARAATTFDAASTDEGAVIRLTNPSQFESGYDGNGFLGGIEFYSGDNSEGGPAVFGAIKQRMLNPFNDTAMCFFTAPSNATLEERMRIDNTGRTIIHAGTLTTPAYTPAQGYPLHVQGITSQCFIGIGRSGQTTGSVGMVVGLDTSTSYLWNRDNIAITFGTNDSTKMLIQAGGNVGIGTSAPIRKLVVAQSNVTEPSGIDTNTSILIKNNTWSGIQMISTEATGNFITFGDNVAGFAGRIQYSHANDAMQFETAAIERMTITSNGTLKLAITNSTSNTLIGKDAGGMYMETNGSTDALSNMRFQARASGAGNYSAIKIKPSNQTLEFLTSNAERVIITSLGNVQIGGFNTTNTKLFVSDANDRAFNGAQFKIEGAGYTAAHFLDATQYTIQQNSASRRIRVMSGLSGGVLLTNGSTAWQSASDISLKENIKPLENVLDKIQNYKCVEYNLKEDKSKGKKIGFIAQDWENDFAPIVDKDNDGLLGMKYTETIPVLLKAIQELKAEVDLLKNK